MQFACEALALAEQGSAFDALLRKEMIDVGNRPLREAIKNNVFAKRWILGQEIHDKAE